MTVDKSGALTWQVPANFTGKIRVIVSLSNTSGDHLIHAYEIEAAINNVGEPKSAIQPKVENPPPIPPRDDQKKGDAGRSWPPAASALEIRTPSLKKEPFIQNFAGPVQRVALGGGGRFLIFYIPSCRRAVLFDANEGTVVHEFPIGSDRAIIAAGMSNLFVIYPAWKVAERWSLLTCKRECVSPIDVDSPIIDATTGYGSDGPIFIATGRLGTGTRPVLLDSRSFTSINTNAVPFIAHPDPLPNLRSSRDGTLLGSGGNGAGISPFHFRLFWGQGGIPNSAGTHFFSSDIFSVEEKKAVISDPTSETVFVPAVHGPWYLAVSRVTRADNDPRGINTKGIRVGLLGTPSFVHHLREVENAERFFSQPASQLSIDQRYHLLAESKLLITLNSNGDQMHVRKLDPATILKESGQSYLAVTSIPNRYVRRGVNYAYSVKVVSSKEKVGFKLKSGPPGMSISERGELSWAVPLAYKENQMDAVIEIENGESRIEHAISAYLLDPVRK